MRFDVQLTDGLLQDVTAMQQRIVGAGSPATARRWTRRLMRALAGLATFPRRHPVARESELFERVVLRQMVFGSIRVLYVVEDTRVVVLHARHASRLDLGPEDVADWPAEVREAEPAST